MTIWLWNLERPGMKVKSREFHVAFERPDFFSSGTKGFLAARRRRRERYAALLLVDVDGSFGVDVEA